MLLTSDTIDVVADPRFVTFMYSYSYLIPLPASKVRAIVAAVEPFTFDRMYESFGSMVAQNARERLLISADRYIRAMSD